MNRKTFIADGRVHQLKPGEVDAWLQFLAEAFAEKGPNMLKVFQKKLNNDTDFHCGDILLLEDTTGCWVSTVHVSRKEMWLNGTCEKLAGIANVATSPAHLRQGYALHVMNCALPHAEDVLGAKIAGLHCSKSQLWPFYEKCGYVHVPLQEDHVTITLPPLHHQQDHKILHCHFTNTQLDQMAEIHKNYYNKFTGPLYRSKEYWNIVPKLVEGMCFGCVYTMGVTIEGDPHTMLAYMGIKLISKHGENVKVEIVEYAGSHEHGCNDNKLFVPLLCHMIQGVCHYNPGDHVSIVYPSLMCNRVWFAAIATTNIETQLHYGFMYRYTGHRDSKDILKLFDKFLFLYTDRF